ncbi:MAG: GNAT family N-acetyltransferase [Ruminococcus sp.]|nr:GNAT family N-acetyltransferase [Ruminococcus sp.]
MAERKGVPVTGIVAMERADLAEYGQFFADAFSKAPWNEPWTKASAAMRIEAMMSSVSFLGLAMYRSGVLLGMIFGQIEFSHSSRQFQIQEFCVAENERGKGLGTALLQSMRQELSAREVNGGIYLITSHGESTEGWYSRHGFRTSEDFIVMNDQ